MNTTQLSTFAALLFLAGTASVRASTITVVDLPATGTDAATGITTNKTYVGAFNYGNQNTTTYSVNGVPFSHFDPGNQIVNVTNKVDATHGGQVILSSGPPLTNAAACKLARISSATQGSLSTQADGTMRSLLTDLIYVGSGAPVGSFLQQEYDNLTIGHQYSLRLYYRYWGNAHGDRTQNVFFNGEGTWEPYANNPLDIDAGGAHYLRYDFTAANTNVFCVMTNLVANGAQMIFAATVEDASVPFAPFITYQPKVIAVGNPSIFTVAAIGTGPLTYQWYHNSVSNYAGATLATDGSDYSGSTTTNLTANNNLLDYYFVVVSNNYGSVTSSITQLNPAPTILSQPAPFRNGTSIGLSVTTGGLQPITYQWYENSTTNYTGTAMTDGGGVSGSTTANVTLNNLFDYYYVVVANNYGSVTSRVAQIAIQLTVKSAGEPIWNQAGQTNVIVTFSDVLDTASATTVGNYSLDNSATVLSAAMGASNEVILTTSPLTPGTSYNLTVQGVKDYFGITMTPSPTSVPVGVYPANLALWVKANTGVTTDADGVSVNQWNDLSGNGNTLFNSTGAPYEPMLATNDQGDSVIRFTATNETFMYAGSSPTLALAGDMSVVAVMSFSNLDGGTNGMIVSKTKNSVPAPFDYYVGSTNVGAKLYRGNGTTYGQFTAASAPSLGIPHLLAVSMSGTNITHYLDGTAQGTGVLNNAFDISTITDAGDPLYIGTREDTVNRLSGDIAELIISGSALSTYDMAALQKYLVQQHHLSFVSTSSPKLVYSLVGNQLNLSWPADHIGWTLQGQTSLRTVGLTTNWNDVANSTSTNQVTIPVNPGDGTAFYRLIHRP